LALELDKLLFVDMFKEEWRLHKSFVGGIGSGFFPVVIFIFSVVLAITSPVFLGNINMSSILLILHVAAVLYGLFVGALGHIGEQVMTRRLGQINLLLQLPQLYPITFKRTMAIFYLKDMLFYILYSLIPLICGIALAAPLAGVTYAGVALLGLTIFITFLMGMGLSFMISAISLRSKAGAGAIGLLILVLVILIWPLGIIRPGQLLLPLGYWYGFEPMYLIASTLLAVLFSVCAVVLMKERFESPQERYDNMLLDAEASFGFTGDMSTLVAKEWVELRRSGALGPVITGFLGPLLAIYVLIWIFESGMGVPLSFNAVFYGGMVGFMGVMTYSWITNLEPNEFLNVQPVSVDQVIKAKLILYFLLTAGVSVGYVVVIAFLNHELDLLLPALLVAGATTIYVAAVTSRLTGLWTNTMLFDAKVLGKFSGAIIPPLILIMIASFWIRSNALVALLLEVLVSVVLLAVSVPIFKDVKARWEKESFSFATMGAESH